MGLIYLLLISCTQFIYSGYRVIAGGKETGDPHLASRLKKEYSYTSAPVLGLACSLVEFIFTFTFMYATYKFGREPENTAWQAAVWRLML